MDRQPPRRPDVPPRISRRSGSVLASFFAFVALCLAAPVLALAFGAVWSVVARTVERSRHRLLMRRHTNGPRPGDVAAVIARSPWYALTALFGTVVALLLPLILGVCTFFAAQILVPTTTQGPAGLVPAAAGAAAAWTTAWWGPGGGGLCRGSRASLRAMTPGPQGALVTVVFCLAVVVVSLYALTTNYWQPNWYPFVDAPWSLLWARVREQWSFVW